MPGSVRSLVVTEGAPPDVYDYRDVFTGAGLQSWYVAGVSTASAATTGAPSANILRAIPFFATSRDRSIDRIAMNVTTLQIGSAHIGLYTNSSQDNLYPSQLVVDSGVLNTGSVGVKAATISTALTAGALYWAVHVGSINATLRCLPLAGMLNLLGTSSAMGAAFNVGISVAFPFADLPVTFPVGGAMIAAVPVPMIAVRFSS
jgi:hypothetical protein